jgi:hypothetical protein
LGLQHLGFVKIFSLNNNEGKKLWKKQTFIFPNGGDYNENGRDPALNGENSPGSMVHGIGEGILLRE